MATERDPIVIEAIEFQRLSAEAFGAQRDREEQALQFQVPMLQWPAAERVRRAGQTINGVPIPARPMLSIPSLSQPIQSIYNQWSRAHYGVQIHPRSPEADDDTAQVLQDIYRHIEVDSRSYIARGWGFDRALKAGFGWYRVDAVYDEGSDDPDDQKLVIRRILRQSSVYADPFALEPDFCDQKRNLIVSYMSRKDFRREHPDAAVAGMESEELLLMQSQIPNWARLNSSGQSETHQEKWYDGANDTVCIAEFFKVEYADETLPADSPRKVRKKPIIKWYKIDALEVLDSRTLDCDYIPVIPCIGNELQPFDSERRWQGIIEPNADSARLLNYEVSNAVETDALRPKAPFVGAVGQFKTNQQSWQQANTRNLPYLEYDPVSAGGNLAPPPQRTESSADLSSSMALISLSREMIQTGTNVVDNATLENLAKRKVAHQTLSGLADGNDTSQSQFLQNMADLTMTYEAKVILSWIPKIYDRAGRIVTARNEKDETRPVMINRPYVLDKGKRPIPAPMQGAGPQGQSAPKPKMHDLRKGVYGVVVSVGKSYQTRAAEGSDSLGELIKAIPEAAPALLPIWAQFQDFPGSKQVESVLKKMQPPQLQQQDEGEPEDADTLRNQRDQAMQIADDLKGKLQQAAQQIETDQAKQQATIAKAQIDAQTDLEKAKIQAQTDIAKAQIQAEAQKQIALLKSETDKELTAAELAHKDVAREDEQRHEHAELSVDRHHDLTIEREKVIEAERNRKHAQQMAERGHEQNLEAGEQAHGQQIEMLERQPETDGE